MFVTELSDSETKASIWIFVVVQAALIWLDIDFELYLVFFALYCIQRWALAAR